MKKEKLILVMMLVLGMTASQIPAAASDDDSDDNFGTRYSVAVDKKLAKGLHVSVEEELRFDGVSDLDRLYTTAKISYKINQYLKVGLGYSAIAASKTNSLNEDYMDWRHRGFGEVTGRYKTGGWTFSLRERFQATYKTRNVNTYQQPKTALALKSRAKVSYGFQKAGLEPYVSVEHRLFLNGAEWDDASTGTSYESSSYLGHGDVYTNRIRTMGGLEWNISKKHSIDFYGLYDSLKDKEIDSKRKSAVLKAPVTTDKTHYFALGIGYTFSF